MKKDENGSWSGGEVHSLMAAEVSGVCDEAGSVLDNCRAETWSSNICRAATCVQGFIINLL